MRNPRRACLALGVAAATAVAMGFALPASASTKSPSWRLAFKHHYSGGGNSLYFAVAAVSRRAAFAVGSANFAGPIGGVPVSARWHDGHWTALTMPSGLTGILGAVSADSSKDAWTVSQLSGLVLHWHNGRWTVARRFSESGGLAQELTGVTAFSPTNVWVFGGSGAYPGVGTWHLHGHVWTKVTGLGGNISFASALSARDMWAVGGINVGQDSIMHYVHGKWHHVTSPALDGLQFNQILALTSNNVWTVASKGGAPSTMRLLQLHNGRWIRHALPKNYDPIDMVADGHGGLWLTAEHTTKGGIQFLHRSASGRWSVIHDPGAEYLALIPGTSSLWGAGSTTYKAGFEAAIYAHGPAS
ncbi:MAG TPA: hypothetical protein VME44_22495 [Streptosporangiaceae bacterium]|nr:hypothetical protein [Streptosporangiaceae bacterium]